MCDADGSRLLERVEVLGNERLTEGVGLLSLHAPRVSADVRPGQFVHLRVTAGADFILRRPFSVHRAHGGTIEILYQVLGRGTRELSLKEREDSMDALGPLGSGWRVPVGAAHALVVAGGLGVAPMGMLLEELARRGVAATVALGAPTAERLLALDVLEANARQVELATDDGSRGAQGPVTDVARELIARSTPDVVFACGPEAMARIVCEEAGASGIPCQVSLERLMACGIGACLSCVVSTTGGLRRACVEGPVFDAADLLWDVFETPPKH